MMRHSIGIRRILALLFVGLILTACGGSADEAEDSGANTLSAVEPTAAQIESSPPVEPMDAPGETVDESPEGSTTEPEEQTESSEETMGEAVPDDPWGKDLPTGPAPTQPPMPPSDFDSDGDGMYTPDELEQAIRHLFPTYDWPENYQVTADIVVNGLGFEASPDSRWEAPGEYTVIGMYHRCAWQMALLDANQEGDAELMEESLHQLRVVSMERSLSNDTEGMAMLMDMYDRASLGDPATLQQWVDNNCNLMNFIAPDSGTPAASRFSEPERMLATMGRHV